MAIQAMEQPFPLAHGSPEPMSVLVIMPTSLAAPEVREIRVKDFIIVFLIIVIVRILWF
jgi:hypothetical protein